MKDIRELMGQKFAMDVLIFVYENPGSMQKIIMEDGNTGTRVRRSRLLELIDANLVRTESGTNWKVIKHFVTEEGARIARGWLALESGEDIGKKQSNLGISESQGLRVK